MELKWIITALLFILVVYFVSGLHTVFYTKYVLNKEYSEGNFRLLFSNNKSVRTLVNNIFKNILGDTEKYKLKFNYSGNNRIVKSIEFKGIELFSYYKRIKINIHVFFINELLKRR